MDLNCLKRTRIIQLLWMNYDDFSFLSKVGLSLLPLWIIYMANFVTNIWKENQLFKFMRLYFKGIFDKEGLAVYNNCIQLALFQWITYIYYKTKLLVQFDCLRQSTKNMLCSATQRARRSGPRRWRLTMSTYCHQQARWA